MLFRRASLLIAFLLAASCFDIASGLEHWPFGSYPMYSLLYSKNLSLLRLYGVNSTGEFLLRDDQDFAPFDQARAVDALARVRKAQLPQALLNLLRLHNHNSRDRIKTLRLYSVTWNLHPGISGDAPPESKRLLLEVSSFER